MRRTSYLHNSSLIRLLTFASVIGVQFHVLPAIVTPTTGDNSGFDAFDTTKTILSSVAAGTISSKSAIFLTSTTSTIFYSKASITMNSNSITGSSISSSKSVTTASTTDSSIHKYWKNTSKLPLDLTGFSKNHWSSSDSDNFGVSAPSASSTIGDVKRPRTFRNKHHHDHHWGPFFEEPLNTTTSGDKLISAAHLFTKASLNCRVGMLKDKTVMWVRRTSEKVSLLTVGNVTYSGDPRIRVKFQYPNNWRLVIDPTQREDAGVYMCQVSTHPPRVFTTNLNILEPPVRLIDDQEREVSDRYYKSGSTIDLQCQASKSFLLKEKLSILNSLQPLTKNQTKIYIDKNNPENLLKIGYNQLFMSINQTVKHGKSFEKQLFNLIFWTKDDEVLPLSLLKRSSSSEKWLNTQVSIPDAKLSDSGNYSCSIGKLFTAIVQVQVLTGELPAAVQHNYGPASHQSMQYICWIHLIAAFTVILHNIRQLYYWNLTSYFC